MTIDDYNRGRADQRSETAKRAAARRASREPAEIIGPTEGLHRRRHPEAHIPDWLTEVAEITDRDIRLFHILDKCVRNGRDCWPGIPSLAKDCKCSVSSIERSLRRLRLAGAVKVTKRFARDAAGGDWQQLTNAYELCVLEPFPVEERQIHDPRRR